MQECHKLVGFIAWFSCILSCGTHGMTGDHWIAVCPCIFPIILTYCGLFSDQRVLHKMPPDGASFKNLSRFATGKSSEESFSI
ncbi:hypothetical protein ACOSP7_026164 [Xanthoceras sorbifolium]